ncbi:MAG: hypothetical protein F6J95_028555 [Leptolyngbya sp. SIO1E4]|nr:hypothetical protein [Leptolyngbya sp. SIO1E4]
MVQKSVPLDLPTFKQSTPSPSGTPSGLKGQKVGPGSAPTAAAKAAERAALPLLPKAKRLNFSSHRNDANAALALDLLADVEAAISGWHQALRQTLLDIQTLYMEGPIVEGWLESVPNQGNQTDLSEEARVLRHGDPAQIAAYVEKISKVSPTRATGGGSNYRLCSLDADGQMQCQVCPPEQLGVISQAIARHQRLRQLVSQKQYLEARLQSAAAALETTRQTLGITSKSSEQ